MFPANRREGKVIASQGNRITLLQAVTTPLGFFVLALLVVESFLGSVIILGNPDTAFRHSALNYGVIMFILVVVVVSIITVWKPRDLTYSAIAHLEERRLERGDSKSGAVQENDPSEGGENQ